MAKLPQGFNVASVDIAQLDFSTVPGGDYKVVMFDSEVKPTKANDGGYVAAKYRVVEGEFSGSVLRTDIINLYNTNPVAARIGAARLAAIATAVGMGNAVITDTADLHNKPFMVRVIEKDNSYTDKISGETKTNKQNEITMILGLDGKPPVKAAGGPVQPAAAQPPQMAPQPAQQPMQQPQQQQAPHGAPAWAGQPAGMPMGQGMPPAQQPMQQPAQQPQQAWGTPPAGAWGGPTQ